jgi:hypothetical protein
MRHNSLSSVGSRSSAQKVSNTVTAPAYRYPGNLAFQKMPGLNLLLTYLAIVVFSIWLLYPSTLVPHIFPDEIHYCVTGENIRWGNGYSLRGAFSVTVPPLQPLFIALVHSFSTEPRMIFFIISVLIMCAALFPCYALARDAGLAHWEAMALGCVAVLSPHMFYAATYMSETLQYPLFFFAFLVAGRWLGHPDLHRTSTLGVTLGVMAMVRYATGTFVAILVVTAIFVCFRSVGCRHDKLRRLAHIGGVVCLYGTFQIGWWVYKVAHGASLLGAYGSAWHRLPYLSFSMIVAYAADALLASGPLTPVAIIAGLCAIYGKNRGLACLTAISAAGLTITTGIFDGGITEEVRERYYMYVLPPLTLIAALGADTLVARYGRRRMAIKSFVTASICLLAVLQFDYPHSRLLPQPWAHLLGGFRGLTWTAQFTESGLAVYGLAFLLGSSALLAIPVSPRAVVLGSALVLNGFSLYGVSLTFANASREGHYRVARFLNALPARFQPGTKVAVAGLPDGFGYSAAGGHRFGDLNRSVGLGRENVWRVEILRRLDIRVIETPSQLLNPVLSQALLLTATPFPRLPQLSYSEGLYVYDLDGAGRFSQTAVKFGPPIQIGPETFSSQFCAQGESGVIRGTGTNKLGFLVFGPYVRLDPGRYRATFHISAAGRSQLELDVNAVGGTEGRLAVARAVATGAPSLEFITAGDAPLEFRINGPDVRGFRFSGLTLERAFGGEIPFTPEYRVMVPARAFATEVGTRTAEGPIVGAGTGVVGMLAYGPYIELPQGEYEGRFLLSLPSGTVYGADVTIGGASVWKSAIPSSAMDQFRFVTDGTKTVEFRVHGPSRSGFRFEGVALKQLVHGL